MNTTGRESELLEALGDVLEHGRRRLQECLLLGQGGAPTSDAVRRAYRERLERLDSEVVLAERSGDLESLVRAVRDREHLFAQLRADLHETGGTAPEQRRPEEQSTPSLTAG